MESVGRFLRNGANTGRASKKKEQRKTIKTEKKQVKRRSREMKEKAVGRYSFSKCLVKTIINIIFSLLRQQDDNYNLIHFIF